MGLLELLIITQNSALALYIHYFNSSFYAIFTYESIVVFCASANQFVEYYHRVVSCALCMETSFRTIFVNSVSNKEISNVF
jgi:hypothetical protein